MTLYDALQRHIRDCGKCQDGLRAAPVGLRGPGEKTRMCADYVNIAQTFADWERDANRGTLISVEQYIDEMRSQQ